MRLSVACTETLSIGRNRIRDEHKHAGGTLPSVTFSPPLTFHCASRFGGDGSRAWCRSPPGRVTSAPALSVAHSLTRQHEAVRVRGHGWRVPDLRQDGHQCGARVSAVRHARQPHAAAVGTCVVVGGKKGRVAVGSSVSEYGAALRVQPMALHGWGNPAGRVNTPASPVPPLEGAGRWWLSCGQLSLCMAGWETTHVHCISDAQAGNSLGEAWEALWGRASALTLGVNPRGDEEIGQLKQQLAPHHASVGKQCTPVPPGWCE